MNMKRHIGVSFRVTPEEKMAIEVLAVSERRRLSEFFRELVRREIQRRGLTLEELAKDESQPSHAN